MLKYIILIVVSNLSNLIGVNYAYGEPFLALPASAPHSSTAERHLLFSNIPGFSNLTDQQVLMRAIGQILSATAEEPQKKDLNNPTGYDTPSDLTMGELRESLLSSTLLFCVHSDQPMMNDTTNAC